MSFELNDEKALDVIIWWVGGSDGSIDYQEKETVHKVLDDMNYSLETYHQDTIMYLGGLSTEHIDDLVEESIRHADANYSEHEKQKVVALLYAVAESDGNISEGEQEKIDRIKQTFGVSDPDTLPYE